MTSLFLIAALALPCTTFTSYPSAYEQMFGFLCFALGANAPVMLHVHDNVMIVQKEGLSVLRADELHPPFSRGAFQIIFRKEPYPGMFYPYAFMSLAALDKTLTQGGFFVAKVKAVPEILVMFKNRNYVRLPFSFLGYSIFQKRINKNAKRVMGSAA